MNSDAIGRINKLFNTCKFKIKEAPVASVISVPRVKCAGFQHRCPSPAPAAGVLLQEYKQRSVLIPRQKGQQADLPKHILGYYKFISYKVFRWLRTMKNYVGFFLTLLKKSEMFSKWHPTPVLLPGKSHGWRSLVGCSPWGHTESDTTERLHFHFSLSCIGEGNGNPLQCSCLENPRDGGAWWAAVYGVARSRTRLK